MAKLDFVDTHVHFYDMQHPELFYWGGQPGVHRTDLDMQIQKLAERNYIAEDYIAETRNANVTKAVHVQAATGTKDPVKETEWLQEAADRTGFPHGIVAYAGNELRGFGNLLLIKHAGGWVSAYAHNDTVLVKRGQKVDKGQKIATVGSTGSVKSPQLHFEIRRGRIAKDPRKYLRGV